MLLLAACQPSSGETGGGQGPLDSGVELPDWWSQSWVQHLTLPAGSGMSWELDPSFELLNFTVPTVLVLQEGGYRMFATDMTNWGSISMLRSDDGVSWGDAAEVVLQPGDFSQCGDHLLDAAVIYLDDGSYRLLVEGSDDLERWFCSALSTDGDTWQAEEGRRWEGGEADSGTVSVPEVLRQRDGRWQLFYLGDMGNVSGFGDGVRIAVSQDGWSFAEEVPYNALPQHDTDPFPVFLDDGSTRLVHTHPVTMGRLAASGSSDGWTFQEPVYLDGLGEGDGAADEKYLDPVVLRLPDQRSVAYFTRIIDTGDEVQYAAVGRAWAVD